MAGENVRRFAKALVLVLLLWLIMTGGELGGVFGVATVVIAAGGALLYLGRWTHRWRWLRLPGFVLFFVSRSFVGGLDVGYRALHPGLPVHPAWIRYKLSLPIGEPRVVMVAVVSLLPGTLAADLYSDELIIHGVTPSAESEVRRLEEKIRYFYALDEVVPTQKAS
ncbi:Na+/H+ antiporter subunit E [Halorhodospira halochloris]|uniref:Na+/H+ antiporter subunit E n=1 Tax=Halorhodospira halochloris TaxID=1052 RepID=UPI001EE8844D|nr:Na+/H+ antiporter subunit E [Halorhodospira halochloris]MCG5531635.1 Na+/H+ antiporter subunit E [Halorhodospira halochloris]MCG5548311.1 Na+/H+ antiporter subunit E [Halorhodospira halochloris]